MSLQQHYISSGAEVTREFEECAHKKLGEIVALLTQGIDSYNLKPIKKLAIEKDHTDRFNLCKWKRSSTRLFMLDIPLKAMHSSRVAMRPSFEFDFEAGEASMHIDPATFRGAARETQGIGSNAFWKIMSNFIQLLPQIGIHKIHLKVANEINGGQQNMVSMAMMLRAGIDMRIARVNKEWPFQKPDSPAAVARQIQQNFSAVEEIMTQEEIGIFERAMKGAAAIDFKALASLPRRIYYDDDGFRQATASDKLSRRGRVLPLGDYLLDGLQGDVMIDNSAPLPPLLKRIFARMAEDPGMSMV